MTITDERLAQIEKAAGVLHSPYDFIPWPTVTKDEMLSIIARLRAAEAVCAELVKVNAWWTKHRIAVDGAIDNVLDKVPAWERLSDGGKERG